MRRFKVIKLPFPYYPEGNPKYDPRMRANALYPGGNKDNNNEQDLDVEASNS